MLSAEKKKAQEEIRPIVRRLDVLTRILNADPDKLQMALAEILGHKDIMEESATKDKSISKELKKVDVSPQIVFIGKTGVGKSSTINKLFNPQPNLPVDHVEPATMNMEILTLSLGDRGNLIFVDCPGLGESEEADKRNMEAYKQILGISDVALWIVKADDRALGIDRYFIHSVLPEKLADRLIVGINQIDLIQPGEWSKEFNLPSKEQEDSILRKEEYVMRKFKEEGINPFAIVSYSAKRNYRLTRLFKTMVDACPPERVPALVKRGDVRSFLSPDLQEDLQ